MDGDQLSPFDLSHDPVTTPAELHVYEDLKSGLLLSSDREALIEELKRLNEIVLAEIGKLLAKIATRVESAAPATRE